MAYTSLTVTCDSLESLWLAQTLTLRTGQSHRSFYALAREI